MHSAYELWVHHSAIVALIVYYVISAAISSLPSPTAKSGMFYLWFFKFSNTIAANLARAYSSAVERSPNFDAAAKLQADQSRTTGGA